MTICFTLAAKTEAKKGTNNLISPVEHMGQYETMICAYLHHKTIQEVHSNEIQGNLDAPNF